MADRSAAQDLAARLLPRLDLVADVLAILPPWDRRRALREILAQELEATLAEAGQRPADATRWGEMRESEVLERLKGLIACSIVDRSG